MAKVYTAQEMREAADNFWVGGVICEVQDEDGRVVKQIKHEAIIAMLRQAADLLEREEKHEKKYEYTVRYKDGACSTLHIPDADDYEFFDAISNDTSSIVRREVGEWEVVKE